MLPTAGFWIQGWLGVHSYQQERTLNPKPQTLNPSFNPPGKTQVQGVGFRVSEASEAREKKRIE